jgi:hypothetical protein
MKIIFIIFAIIALSLAKREVRKKYSPCATEFDQEGRILHSEVN